MSRALIAASAIAFLWLAATASWVHVEAVSSAYSARQACGSALWLCLDYFDGHPFRFRPVSQVVEMLDMLSMVKAHPFFGSASAVLSAMLCPLLVWRTGKALGLKDVERAVLVLFLLAAIGFLSAHLIYFRPAKRLVILSMLATAWALSENRFRWAVVFSALGAMSDEVGLMSWVVPFAAFRPKIEWPWVGKILGITLAVLLITRIPHIGQDLTPHAVPHDPTPYTDAFPRLLEFIGGPLHLGLPMLAAMFLIFLPRALALAVLALGAWCVALSFIGGPRAVYVDGYYYGSHMAAVYVICAMRVRPLIPALLLLAVLSAFSFQAINSQHRMVLNQEWAQKWKNLNHRKAGVAVGELRASPLLHR